MRKALLFAALLAIGCEPAPTKSVPPAPASPRVGPTLMVFSAKWRGPCEAFAPTVESLARDFNVVKVDIDERPDLARQYHVQSIPRSLVISDGRVVANFGGVTPEEKIRAQLNAVK